MTTMTRQKLKAGVSVMYRLTPYSMVKIGTLYDRASTDKGWIVKDEADRRLYVLRDGVSKIRIPEPEQLEAYRKRVKARAASGRAGVLPDKMNVGDREFEDMAPLELEAHGETEAAAVRTADDYSQGELFTKPSVKSSAPAAPKTEDVGGRIADAVHEEIRKEKKDGTC